MQLMVDPCEVRADKAKGGKGENGRKWYKRKSLRGARGC